MGAFTDIRTGDWADRWLPAAARPYARLARLDRPIGWWLLLFPCWWGLALSSPGRPDPVLFLLFLIGAVAMRGAGCTLNDIVDRDFDARVARTRSRPIPSGQVTVPAAFLFMGLELAVGAAVLVSLRPLAIALALAILAVVVIYPFMKRVTFWPQLFLGINFNWGAVVGWAAATGRLDWPALALYAAGICWTLGYDTIYAHADKADDLAIGVKSTALRLAERSRAWVAGFFAAASAGLALALGLAHAHWLSYLFLAMAACHFAWQVRGWRLDDPADCIARFKSNRFVGWLVLAGCLAAGLPR